MINLLSASLMRLRQIANTWALHLTGLIRDERFSRYLDELTVRKVVWSSALFIGATSAAVFATYLDKSVAAAMVYLLGITTIGATQGLVLGVISALSASGFYYNFINPDQHVSGFTDPDAVVALIAFLSCAVVAGIIAGRLKDHAAESQRNAEALSGLLDASRRLQHVFSPADLVTAIPDFAPFRKHFTAEVYLCTGSDLKPFPTDATLNACDDAITNCGRDLFNEFAGGSPGGKHAHALRSPHGLMGALVVAPRDARVSSDEIPSLSAYIGLISVTLERCFLLERLAATQAVERSETFKTALLSSLSHDMRTPLAAIRASASGLRELKGHLSAEATSRLLGTITEQSDRLNRFMTDLLTLARAEGPRTAETQPLTNLIEVLDRAIDSVQPILGSRQIERHIPRDPAWIRADSVLLEQVFHNILQNAVRYSSDGSEISISMRLASQTVRIEITDEGIGIPQHAIERVFERFYRVERRSVGPAGIGIGLAIAKTFAESVGGTISAQSPVRDEHGTRMTVTLPLSRGAW